MSKVSVVIPSYNYGKFVREAVDSVLSQTYADFEIVLVDDGSRDNTRETLQDYIDAGRINYIYKENGGLPAARNTGIQAASGEYIAMLDADDKWLPRKLELQMAYMTDNPDVDVLFCDELRFQEGREPQETPRKLLAGENIREKFLISCFTIPSSLLFKKKSLTMTGLFDEKLQHCEDWDMMMRMAYKLNVAYLPEYLVLRRIHSSSMSVNIKNKSVYYKRFYNNNKVLLDNRQKSVFRKNVGKRCFVYATRFIDVGKTSEALKVFAMSVMFYPLLSLKFPSLMMRLYKRRTTGGA